MLGLVLAIRVALGAVLVAAAVGKLISRPDKRDLLIAGAEGLLAAALLSGLTPIIPALAVCAVAVAYVGHAVFTREQKCNCFGSRLPATSRTGQLFRNGVFGVLAMAYTLSLGLAGSPGLSLADGLLPIGIGILAGLALIVVPWAFEWSLGVDPVA